MVRSRSLRLGVVVAILTICIGARSVWAGADTTCARDVLVANSMQRQAIDQLEATDDNEASRCRVWRRHVDTMRRIASVYGRCLSGPERKQRLDQVQGSEAEFGGLVRTRCKGL